MAPMTYFVNLMTGLWIVLSQPISAGRNMKLPICREMVAGKHIKTVLCDAVFARLAAKGNTPKKSLKGGIDRNGKDNCRLCCCLLKIKFREFKKISYISSQLPERHIQHATQSTDLRVNSYI